MKNFCKNFGYNKIIPIFVTIQRQKWLSKALQPLFLGIIMAGIINISLENISLRGGVCLVADNSKARFSRFIRL